MNEAQRRDLLALGHLALAEIEASHLDHAFKPEAPYVFEDALRELLPSSHVYLADRIAASRNHFEKSLHLRDALQYLQAVLPITLRSERALERVVTLLESAARRGALSDPWWLSKPLFREPGRTIHAAVRVRSGYSTPLQSPALARHARSHVLHTILENGLQVYRKSAALPKAIERLAQRVTDVVMETR